MEQILLRTQACLHLDFRLLASRICERINFCYVKPPSFWQFFIAALGNSYRWHMFIVNENKNGSTNITWHTQSFTLFPPPASLAFFPATLLWASSTPAMWTCSSLPGHALPFRNFVPLHMLFSLHLSFKS